MSRLKYIGEKHCSDLGDRSEKGDAQRWETTYCFAIKLLKKRERGGGRRKEKSSRRLSNKADSTQIASERPRSRQGLTMGEKSSSSPEDVVRAGERHLQRVNSLPYHWGPFFMFSALQITF